MIQNTLREINVKKFSTLFLWTGQCNPNFEQMKTLKESRLLNLNGGDSRFDRRYDSVSYIYPLGININGILQYYSSNSNENTYTNLWKSAYFGFYLASETFDNTESPRRLRPINIYYHFYSGERVNALKALKQVYNKALNQDIFPIYTSRYPRILKGYYDVKITKTNTGFKIQNHGQLRTIRFDDELRHVDMIKSKNILGYIHFQGNLYIHLKDENDAHISLSSKSPDQVYLKKSSFDVFDFKNQNKKITFLKNGWHKSHATLGGLTKNQPYKITSGSDSYTATADSKGELSLKFLKVENGGKSQLVVIEDEPL